MFAPILYGRVKKTLVKFILCPHVHVMCKNNGYKDREYLTNSIQNRHNQKKQKIRNIKILSLQPNPDRSFIVRYEMEDTVGSFSQRARICRSLQVDPMGCYVSIQQFIY